MEPLDQLKEILQSERPVSWDDFPDLSLYMDQVISYMPRQLISAGTENDLTSAMVNNYIKDELLPRAEGKKYTRVHLAYLTMICALKQVLSVKEIKYLLEGLRDNQEPDVFYAGFCTALDEALSETADAVPDALPAEDRARIAFTFALRSYANRLVCARILGTLIPPDPKKSEKSKKNKTENG